jgi:hypothetical protein
MQTKIFRTSRILISTILLVTTFSIAGCGGGGGGSNAEPQNTKQLTIINGES